MAFCSPPRPRRCQAEASQQQWRENARTHTGQICLSRVRSLKRREQSGVFSQQKCSAAKNEKQPFGSSMVRIDRKRVPNEHFRGWFQLGVVELTNSLPNRAHSDPEKWCVHFFSRPATCWLCLIRLMMITFLCMWGNIITQGMEREYEWVSSDSRIIKMDASNFHTARAPDQRDENYFLAALRSSFLIIAFAPHAEWIIMSLIYASVFWRWPHTAGV